MNSLRSTRVQRPFLVLFTFCFAFVTAAFAVGVAQQESAPRRLESGPPLTRTLAGGEQHRYEIALTAGQYLHVVVEQRGIDLVLTWVGPDGKQLLEGDSPNGDQGPEPLYWVAETTGVYRLNLHPIEEKAAAAQYEIRIAALRVASELDRKQTRALITYAEGERLFDERKAASYQLAIPQYEIAAPLWHELGDFDREAYTRLKLGLTHNALGQKQQALVSAQEATLLYRQLKKQDWEATALNNVGTAYNDLGDKRKALAAFNDALALRRETKDRVGEAITLNSLGATYRDLGEREKALQHYLLSLQIRRELKDRVGEASTLNNLAVLYDDLGEVQQMLDINAQVLPLRRDPLGRAITLNNIGRGYDRLGSPQEALRYFEQALPLTRQVGDKLWEGRTLNFMGLAYWSLGEQQTALAHFNQALPLFRLVRNVASEASTWNNLGLVYNALQQLPAAQQAYQTALPLFRTANDRLGEASVLYSLGIVYERLGESAKALDQHQRSLQLSRELGDPRRLAKANYGIARIKRLQGKFAQARTHVEQSIAHVELMRAKLDSPELRAAFRAATQEYYDLYVDVLMRQHRQQPSKQLAATALQISERARARSLIEMLSEANANLRQGVEESLLQRERELQDKLNEKTAEQIRLMSGEATPAQTEAVSQMLAQLTASLRDAQAEIRRRSPQYAALTQPEPLTVRAMQQQLLAPNTMLLEYALGEDRSYLWAVTNTSLHSYTLPKRAVLEAAARRYYELLTASNQVTANDSAARLAQAEADCQAAGLALSKFLLGPVAAQLGNKRLLIVSDGALQYVPFAALPEPVVGNQLPVDGKRATDNRQPLIVNHEIVNLPSASTLAVLRNEQTRRQPTAAKIAVVLADPVFDNKDERVKTVKISAGQPMAVAKPEAVQPIATPETARILLLQSAKTAGLNKTETRIPRLPNTRSEAQAILALAGGEKSLGLFDFAVTRAAAMSEELGRYRIVHFATHGFLNSTNPALSGLVLSLVDEKGKPQNGFLLAPEVYQLKLSATELVVLSACQTGLGQEVRGEGVIGLTRGFMYAGAPRVVVSLWNVSDEATAELMKHLYDAMLRQGQRPAAALRTAQLALWKERKWRAPYYWAAFGLQGEWK